MHCETRFSNKLAWLACMCQLAGLPDCVPTLQEIDAELDAAAEQLLALLQALQDRERLANPSRQRLVSGLRCDAA